MFVRILLKKIACGRLNFSRVRVNGWVWIRPHGRGWVMGGPSLPTAGSLGYPMGTGVIPGARLWCVWWNIGDSDWMFIIEFFAKKLGVSILKWITRHRGRPWARPHCSISSWEVWHYKKGETLFWPCSCQSNLKPGDLKTEYGQWLVCVKAMIYRLFKILSHLSCVPLSQQAAGAQRRRNFR